MSETACSIISRIEDLAKARGLAVVGMLVGSAARDTWLAGDYDLDIFLAMPEDSELDSALALARLVAPEHEEKYAEHAYVHAYVDGFEVDLVPCYLLEDASRLRSAVDRTPFHTKYLSSRIKGLEDDVLLLKQFMKGVGVYGSELKTGGFSGYLTELLVLHYGSFRETLQAASSWRPGEAIDLEGHGLLSHEEPLTVVDPVDPARNVAASLTLDKMFQFAAAARCFLADPDLNFFFSKEPEPLSEEELKKYINNRGSTFILLEFEAPAVVEDVLFPQLRKAEAALSSLLERNCFTLVRSDVAFFEGRAAILFELEVSELPRVSRRVGPPIWEVQHLSKFLAAHPKPLSGPYIENGRAVVELPRKHTTAISLLAAEIVNASLGKHLAPAVRKAHNIYVDSELACIQSREFRIFMARYLKAQARVC